VPLGWQDDPRSGGADHFLRFIREELIPFVGAEYRVDPHDRCLWGDSLGGLFGLHVLFSQPDTFTRYILGSPWIDQDNHPVFQCEHVYAMQHTDLQVRVFMGVGSQEFAFVINNLVKLAGLLQDRGYGGLELTMQIFEGESHVSVMPINLSKGIRAVYR
jgi:predicted alpha/beta superfamily hydrolase